MYTIWKKFLLYLRFVRLFVTCFFWPLEFLIYTMNDTDRWHWCIWYRLSLQARAPDPFFPFVLCQGSTPCSDNEYGYGLIRLSYYSPSFNKDKCMSICSFKLPINFVFHEAAYDRCMTICCFSMYWGKYQLLPFTHFYTQYL
jgi:hypothetical protein